MSQISWYVDPWEIEISEAPLLGREGYSYSDETPDKTAQEQELREDKGWGLVDGFSNIFGSIADSIRGGGPQVAHDIGEAMKEVLVPIDRVAGEALGKADKAITDLGLAETRIGEAVSAAVAKAEAAQKRADKGVEDAKAAIDSLETLGERVEERVGEDGDITKELNSKATQEEYNELNSRLWGDQGVINKQQDAINTLGAEVDIAQNEAISANTSLAKLAFPHLNLLPSDESGVPLWKKDFAAHAQTPTQAMPEELREHLTEDPNGYELSGFSSYISEHSIAHQEGLAYRISAWVLRGGTAGGLSVRLLDENGQHAISRWRNSLNDDWTESSFPNISPSGNFWERQEVIVEIKPGVKRVALGLGLSSGREYLMVGLQMRSFFPVQAEIDRAQNMAIDAVGRAQAVTDQEATRMIWAVEREAAENDDVKLSNPRLATDVVVECKGDWEGMVVLMVEARTGSLSHDTQTQTRRWFVTKTDRTFVHGATGTLPHVYYSTLFYQKWSPGSAVRDAVNYA